MTLLALLLFAADLRAEVRPGMTMPQVKAALGAPAAVSRQVVAHRAIEQWHYGGDVTLRLTFDCRRGKPPVLETVTRVNR